MKNIFLARTGASTRLYKNAQGVFELRDKEERVTDETSQNYWMYIITEESFSQGDFITDDYVSASRVRSTTIEALKENGCYEQFKKVILTTHGYLINEGIQSIDDEFLEWFVKNPSCEFVEIERLEDGKYIDRFADGTIKEGVYENYKIIIPQEQPKPTPTENPPIKNGDVYDMGQTVNGVSRFLFLNEKWYYFEERLSREYEYDQSELTKLVNDTENDFNEVKYIGNIFSLNLSENK